MTSEAERHVDEPSHGPHFSIRLPTLFAATPLCLASVSPCLAGDEAAAMPKVAAITVPTAAKSCFDAMVEASGIVIPREATALRPNRPSDSLCK